MLPYPIPVELSGAGGGLVAKAAIGKGPPVLAAIDTGTILTTFSQEGAARAQIGDLLMYAASTAGAVPRLSIRQVQLFFAPLGSLGVGDAALPLGAVIGGDQLSRFALALDYRGAAPTVTLSSNVTPCSCELAPDCDRKESCFAVLPFTLQGGQDTGLQGLTRIALGSNLYAYPPTRVLLDACVEPFADPVESIICAGGGESDCPRDPAYMPSGVDMKLLVATGFPGVALSANAYDRLRGVGAAAQLLASPTTRLHLIDPADGDIATTATKIGRASTDTARGAAALALVSNEPYFGPCALLARSRRQRRLWLHPEEAGCQIDSYRKCLVDDVLYDDAAAVACRRATSRSSCDDITDQSHRTISSRQDTPTPAVVELGAPLDVYVLSDLTPLLVGINGDVRPTAPTVDGILGTSALSRLVQTIDYPGGRVIARCAGGVESCVAYPRLAKPSILDCGFCQESLHLCPDGPGYHACPPAP